MSSPEAESVESALACMDALLQKSIAAAEAGDETAVVPPEVVQRVLELGTRLYAAEMQSGRSMSTFREHHGVSATDVMITTTGLLKAVNIQLFELGMWQMWAKK
jgi:hypothetical protein